MKEMSDIAAALAAPFDVSEIKFRPGPKSRDGKSALALAYIDARNVMDRLDEVMGVDNWGTRYTVVDQPSKAVECQLTLHFDDRWVTKSDVGFPNDGKDADNNSSAHLKAAYSDALKRAAVQFGIGRFLYSLELERDYMPINEFGRFTETPRIKGSSPARTPAPEAPARASSRTVPATASTPPVQETPPAPSQTKLEPCAHEQHQYTADGLLICEACGTVLDEGDQGGPRGVRDHLQAHSVRSLASHLYGPHHPRFTQ